MDAPGEDEEPLSPYISRLLNTAQFLEHVIQPEEPLPPLLRGRSSNLEEVKQERRGLAQAKEFRMSFMRKASCTSFKVRQGAEDTALFGAKGVLEFKVMGEEQAQAQAQAASCPNTCSSVDGTSKRMLPALSSTQAPCRLETLLRSMSSRRLTLPPHAGAEQEEAPSPPSGRTTPCGAAAAPALRSSGSLQPSLSALSGLKLPHLPQLSPGLRELQERQQQRRQGSGELHNPLGLGPRGSVDHHHSECSDGSAVDLGLDKQLGFARSRSCMLLDSPGHHSTSPLREAELTRGGRAHSLMAPDLGSRCDAAAAGVLLTAPKCSPQPRGRRPGDAEPHATGAAGTSLILSRTQKPTPLQERMRSCKRILLQHEGRTTDP